MHKITGPFGSLCSWNYWYCAGVNATLSHGFNSPFKTVIREQITRGLAILIYRVQLRDSARSLQDSVALPEVAPPHVLIGDLDDVSHGEPALLSIRQADALVHG